ncbi:MAG: hypothetical protein M0Z79_01310 [Nitrospiraceae bacterium]|nr:hypothetical protein [Nitrospiraceae bacterium]
MKTELFTKTMLVIIAVLLFLNLVSGLLPVRKAIAQQDAGPVNRYQISAWAASIGTYGHHAGYFVVDTVTGKVVDKKEEVHTITPK